MKQISLDTGWVFHEDNPYAEPLYVDTEKRVLRFTLRPGQQIREHVAPHSPVHMVILQGQGVFTGEDGVEHQVGQGHLLIFDSGEKHSIRALNAELVFVAFLHGVPQSE